MPDDSSRSSSPGLRDASSEQPGAQENGGDQSDALRQVPKVRASQAALSLPSSLPSRAGRMSRTRGRLSVMHADALKSSKALLEQRHQSHSNAGNDETLGSSLSASSDLAAADAAAPLSDNSHSLMGQMAEAKEALEAARLEITTLEALHGDSALCSECSELEAEVQAAREAIAGAKAGKAAVLEASLAEAVSEIASQRLRLDLHVEEAMHQKSEMEAQEEVMKRERVSLRLSEHKLADVNAKVAEQDAEKAEMQKHQLQQQDMENEQCRSEVAQLKDVIAEAQASREALLVELREASADQARLQEEVWQMKAQAEDLGLQKQSCEELLSQETATSKQRAESLSELLAQQSQEAEAVSQERIEFESRAETWARELQELSEECRTGICQQMTSLNEMGILQAEVRQERQKSAGLATAEHRLSVSLENHESLSLNRSLGAKAGRTNYQEASGSDHEELSEQMEYLRQQELDLRRAIAAHRYVIRNSTTLPPPAPVDQSVPESDAASADEPVEDEIGTTVKLSNRPSTSECQDFLFGFRRSGMPGSTMAWLHGAT